MKLAIGGKFYCLNREMPYGGERQIVYLAEELAKRGHEIFVFAQTGSWIPGCTIIETNINNNYKDNFADAIENSGIDFNTAILSDDTGVFNMPRFPFKYFFVPYGYRVPVVSDKNCNVVCQSQSQFNILKHPNSCVISPGLPSDLYKPSSERGDYWCWVGKINQVKPVHWIVEACMKRKEKLIICAFIEDFDYFRHFVKPYIDNKNIVLLENVNDYEKIEILSKAKGLLSPVNCQETFGINHIESLMCGTPVIYNDLHGIYNQHAPIFHYGSESCCIRVEGKDDLTEKFSQKMDEIKPEMNKFAREFALKNFDIKVIADKWESLVGKSLNGR